MLSLAVYLRPNARLRVFAGLIVAAAAIAFLGFLPSAAHASGCTDSWTNTAGGSWYEGSNWSTKAPPKEGEEACITAAGTYTVTMNQPSEGVTVKSLTIGGTSGTQTLSEASTCGAHAKLTTTSGLAVEAHGALVMTKHESCNNNVRLAGPITNSGTITSENVEGTGHRFIEGSLVNKGTLNIDVWTELAGKGHTLTNEGTLNLATGVPLVGATETAVVNASGSISATGSGEVAMEPGSSFTQGAGTTTGSAPVVLRDAALHYTGSGSSTIAQRGEGSTLSGNISSGQSLLIESTCGEHAKDTASESFSNAGSITLTKIETCNNTDHLAISSGTLSNSGTITSENVEGTTHRYIEGSLTNKGTLNIDVWTEFAGKGHTLTNEGTLNLATGVPLVGATETAVENASGSISATGSGEVAMEPGSSFTEGAGTTSGTTPVVIRDAALHYTGSGASTIAARGEGGTLSGNLSVGQSLNIQSDNGEHAKETASASFSNGGSITLTKIETSNNNARLVISSGTLTNSGTITSENVEGTGHRFIEGSLINKGTLAIDVYTEYDGSSATLTNEGAIDVAAGQSFVVSNKDAVINGTGGSIVAGEGAVMQLEPGSSFTEGEGTTGGASVNPVVVRDGSLAYTGAGASVIDARGEGSTLSGNISAGQTLRIESTNGEHAKETASASFTNAGSITLTKIETSNNNARLVISSGTLTNSGTITSENVAGTGHRFIEGNLINKGTLAIDVPTEFNGAHAKLTNEGTIDLATGAFLEADVENTIENNAGTIASTGTGYLYQVGGTFDQGLGTTSGEPVYLDRVALHYKGAGASSLALRGTSSLSGNIAKGQTLTIESTCGEHANVTGTTLSNSGTLVLTNAESCGNNAVLNLAGKTLTNKPTGNIVSEHQHGGERRIEGNVKDEGKVTLGAGITLHISGTFTDTAKATLNVDVAGTSFGALAVGKTAKLAGALDVTEVEAFSHKAGEGATIVTASALSGKLTDLDAVVSSTPGLWYQPSYTATSAALTATQATVIATPTEGPGGTKVTLKGTGFAPSDKVTPSFVDAKKVTTKFAAVAANASGEFSVEVTVPAKAAKGAGTFKGASAVVTGLVTITPFTVS